MPLSLATVALLALVSFSVYHLVFVPRRNPLRKLPGPPVRQLFGNHLEAVLNPEKSPITYDNYVKTYGRSMRIRGVSPWSERLLTLDPVSITHILKHTDVYQKPWQSRRLITNIIGCGMLSAEGLIHKRQRRVATPAFSLQNLRKLVPVVFSKGNQLKEKWIGMLHYASDTHQGSLTAEVSTEGTQRTVIDVSHWISRATFDIIGLAGFDYHFNAIENETNELFLAYKEMFEVAISQSSLLRTMMSIYCPAIQGLFPDKLTRIVQRGQRVIERVAVDLIQEKKRKIADREHSSEGRDLLTRLLESNNSIDLPPEHRISDEDILNNINTFMFAGSDTTSLTVSWALYLLAENQEAQAGLRKELFSVIPPGFPHDIDLSVLTEEQVQSLYNDISALPYLQNVVQEVLRLIPPLHSSMRVATQDDAVPTMHPVGEYQGNAEKREHSFVVPKGTFIHVPIEAFNLDKEIWGEDAWSFNPDRWDNLPEKATSQPGLFSNLLTFSAGPRSCIGMRFSLIEIKIFLFILTTNLVFKPTDDVIVKANIVLTRPYVKGKFSQGSQLPLIIERYRESEA
ncbi:hypothetical protein V5O48_006462 [Marasmius crinis-equi]|uniref:Cytochrome P450 n=1 Tax=Marasmius crinis-equi TaxID=585013 RepID=A0ABR3FKB3_9AGAR